MAARSGALLAGCDSSPPTLRRNTDQSVICGAIFRKCYRTALSLQLCDILGRSWLARIALELDLGMLFWSRILAHLRSS